MAHNGSNNSKECTITLEQWREAQKKDKESPHRDSPERVELHTSRLSGMKVS